MDDDDEKIDLQAILAEESDGSPRFRAAVNSLDIDQILLATESDSDDDDDVGDYTLEQILNEVDEDDPFLIDSLNVAEKTPCIKDETSSQKSRAKSSTFGALEGVKSVASAVSSASLSAMSSTSRVGRQSLSAVSSSFVTAIDSVRSKARDSTFLRSASVAEEEKRKRESAVKKAQIQQEQYLRARRRLSSILDEHRAKLQQNERSFIEGANIIGVKSLEIVNRQLGFSFANGERKNSHSVGLSTCIKVHTKYVLVGTSRGLTLVFDHFQSLRFVIGGFEGKKIKNESSVFTPTHAYGGVTSLDISPNPGADFIVCGYTSGVVTLWETASGKELKAASGIHNSAVTNVCFYKHDAGSPSPSVLSTDELGHAYLLTFTNYYLGYSYSSQLLIRAKGQIFDIVAAPFSSSNKSSADNDTVLPILARGWGPTLELLAVQPGEKNGIQFRRKAFFKMPSLLEIIALSWLSPHELLVLTSSMDAFVYSAWQLGILERVSLSSDFITFRNLLPTRIIQRMKQNTIGATEKVALSAKASRIFSLSIATSNPPDGAVYVLGTDGLRQVKVQSMKQRIDALVDAGAWLEALGLALENYSQQSLMTDKRSNSQFYPRSKSVITIQKDMAEVTRKELNQMTIDLLLRYTKFAVNGVLNRIDNKNQTEFQQRFEEIAEVCIGYCVAIDRCDILFRSVYDCFCDLKKNNDSSLTKDFLLAKHAFLELLEPQILSRRVQQLTPAVAQDIITLYRKKNKLDKVERLLLCMDIQSIDINGIVKLCRSNRLHTALVYIYSQGLSDYITPLQYLLDQAADSATSSTAAIVKLTGADADPGAKCAVLAMEFICATFRGIQWPKKPFSTPTENQKFTNKTINKTVLGRVQREISSLLLSRDDALELLSSVSAPMLFETLECILSSDANFAPNEQVEKATATSNLFQRVEDKKATRVRDIIHTTTTRKKIQNRRLQCPSRQSFIDSVINLMETSPFISEGDTSIEARNHLCIFLAKQISRDYQIVVPYAIIGKIVQTLITIKGNSDFPFDCEKTVVEMLRKIETNKEMGSWLALLQEAGFDSAVVLLQRRSGSCRDVIDTYLTTNIAVEAFKNGVFQYAEEEIAIERKRNDRKKIAELKSAWLTRLPTLLSIDASYATGILLRLCPEGNGVTIGLNCIATSPNSLRHQYDLLSAVVGAQIGDRSEIPPELYNTVDISLSQVKLYFKLLCTFEPNNVVDYLAIQESLPLSYCLDQCNTHGIVDGSAFLLERMGDVTGAYRLSFNTLNPLLAKFSKGNDTSSEQILRYLNSLLSLCTRNSSDHRDCRNKWFEILDLFSFTLLKENGKDKTKFLIQCIRKIMFAIQKSHSMSMDDVVEKICKSYGRNTLNAFLPYFLSALYDRRFLLEAHKISLKLSQQRSGCTIQSIHKKCGNGIFLTAEELSQVKSKNGDEILNCFEQRIAEAEKSPFAALAEMLQEHSYEVNIVPKRGSKRREEDIAKWTNVSSGKVVHKDIAKNKVAKENLDLESIRNFRKKIVVELPEGMHLEPPILLFKPEKIDSESGNFATATL
eukprot:g4281.t1